MILSVDEKKSSKRELKELRKIEEARASQAAQKQNMVKWVIIGGLSLIFITFFATIIVLLKKDVAPISLSSEGWTRGNEAAQITLVEFADFQCPACKAYKGLVAQVLADSEVGPQVKLLFKHFPLSMHKNAIAAAKASEAAGIQGKFWEYHDLLYEKQEEWAELSALDAEKMFVGYADALKLDKAKFELDMESDVLAEKVTSQVSEGASAGVLGTPSFFINGEKIDNPQSLDDFKKIILQKSKGE
jgi:protein-disulfide isomerase